jgi:hypothetical protein
MICPLCEHSRVGPFATAHGRRYLRCDACLLTFLHPEDRLAPPEERAR